MTTGQELDDVIDRVAAEMTFVPGDATFCVDVVPVGGTRRQRVQWWAAVAAAAVLVVVTAASVLREAPSTLVVAQPPSMPTVPTTERSAPERTPIDIAAAERADTYRPGPPRRHAVAASGEPIRQIAAIEPPTLIDLPALPTDELTIRAIGPAPLELPSLIVTEIDDGRDKE